MVSELHEREKKTLSRRFSVAPMMDGSRRRQNAQISNQLANAALDDDVPAVVLASAGLSMARPRYYKYNYPDRVRVCTNLSGLDMELFAPGHDGIRTHPFFQHSRFQQLKLCELLLQLYTTNFILADDVKS
jgi:hypothetical protein